MKRPITILNLSDLHIAEKNIEGLNALKSLSSAILSFVNENQEQLKWLPDYIVVPGDIIDAPRTKTTKDKEKAYLTAAKVLNEIRKELICNDEKYKDRVILVPGNHDTQIQERDFCESLKRALKAFCESDRISNNKKKQKTKSERLIKTLKNLCKNKICRRLMRVFKNFCQSKDANDFITNQAKRFKLFSDTNGKYIDKDRYHSYYKKNKENEETLRYVSGLKVFKDHEVCFLCLNTEWLFTKDKDYCPKELDTPNVIYLTNKLNEPEYKNYTVITLMHRKPDDLSWETKNHTDSSRPDALCAIEKHTDIIISGHDHAIRTNRPDMIKNYIQHFKLGSPSWPVPDPSRNTFRYSVSAIRIDPIKFKIELLTGEYNRYDNSNEKKWSFKVEGIFNLRNKYAHTTIPTTRRFNTKVTPIRLKARSDQEKDIESAMEQFFTFKFSKSYKLIPKNINKDSFTYCENPEHWVLYILDNTSQQPLLFKQELDRLEKKYKDLNSEVELYRAILLKELIISKVIIVTPKN